MPRRSPVTGSETLASCREVACPQSPACLSLCLPVSPPSFRHCTGLAGRGAPAQPLSDSPSPVAAVPPLAVTAVATSAENMQDTEGKADLARTVLSEGLEGRVGTDLHLREQRAVLPHGTRTRLGPSAIPLPLAGRIYCGPAFHASHVLAWVSPGSAGGGFLLPQLRVVNPGGQGPDLSVGRWLVRKGKPTPGLGRRLWTAGGRIPHNPAPRYLGLRCCCSEIPGCQVRDRCSGSAWGSKAPQQDRIRPRDVPVRPQGPLPRTLPELPGQPRPPVQGSGCRELEKCAGSDVFSADLQRRGSED